MGRRKNPKIEKRAIQIFKTHGGVLRYAKAINLGIHPRTLFALCREGHLEQVQRGLYALPGLAQHMQPDLAIVASKVATGVVCLISALFLHGMTTQIPHFIYLAVEQGYKPPKVYYPPTKYYWFSGSNFKDGVEVRKMNGVTVRCYSREKTLVDCFRFRNKIGIDVAIEALKKYWQQGRPRLDLIWKFAKSGRVEKIMKPYIETVINESS